MTASNFNIQKVEQEDQKEAETENHPPLHSELEATLGYKRQCLKKKKKLERERERGTPDTLSINKSTIYALLYDPELYPRRKKQRL